MSESEEEKRMRKLQRDIKDKLEWEDDDDEEVPGKNHDKGKKKKK